MNLSETQLLQQFYAGNQTAFKEIYNSNYDAVLYKAESILNSKSEAEDIASEVFLKIWKKRKDFTDLINIRAYLLTMSYNEAINRLARIDKEKKAVREFNYLYPADQIAQENKEIQYKVYARVLEEIEQLPPQCRKIFELRYIGQKNNQTIAEELNVTDKTVRNQLTLARNLLREKLPRHMIDRFMLLCAMGLIIQSPQIH